MHASEEGGVLRRFQRKLLGFGEKLALTGMPAPIFGETGF